MTDDWTFQSLTIEQKAHSNDQRSMVGHSNYSCTSEHAHLNDRWSMVDGWTFRSLTSEHLNDQQLMSMVRHSKTFQALTTEQHMQHLNDRQFMIGHSNRPPPRGTCTRMIDGQWLDIPITIKWYAHSNDQWSMVGHSNVQSLIIQVHVLCEWLEYPTISCWLFECVCMLFDGEWLECPIIDRWSFECTCCSVVGDWNVWPLTSEWPSGPL